MVVIFEIIDGLSVKEGNKEKGEKVNAIFDEPCHPGSLSLENVRVRTKRMRACQACQRHQRP